MGKRRAARILALQYLFQREFLSDESSANINSLEALAEIILSNGTAEKDYAQQLVEIVLANQQAIDEMVRATSRHWDIKRISYVDLNTMRIAVAEMLFLDSPLSAKIVISEAIEIAKVFGDNGSKSFVNGILDAIAQKESKKLL